MLVMINRPQDYTEKYKDGIKSPMDTFTGIGSDDADLDPSLWLGRPDVVKGEKEVTVAPQEVLGEQATRLSVSNFDELFADGTGRHRAETKDSL